jgi:rhodanese-related sulfurtransferase
VIVADRGQDVAEAAAQFIRIGIDDVRGVFYDLEGWAAEGRELRSHRVVTVPEMYDAMQAGDVEQILDVRAPNEWEAGAIEGSIHAYLLEGSIHAYLPDLTRGVPGALSTDSPVWMVCGTGFRATAGVKWLEEKGHDPIVLIDEGVPELLARLN